MSKEILDRHRELWKKKKLTRYLYAKWYEEIAREFSPVDAPAVEIGSGTGNFKDFMPSVIASDIVRCDWLDMVNDAMALPYGDSTIGNFVLIDAIHHVSDPVAAITEMSRCLRKKGRIIIYDVFISWFSYLYYNFLHDEDVDLSADLFNMTDRPGGKAPFSSNQAVATLLFFKEIERFKKRFPGLKAAKREVREFLLYPLSGGFDSPQLVPAAFAGFFEAVDGLALGIFGDKIAARCFVVLEKEGD